VRACFCVVFRPPIALREGCTQVLLSHRARWDKTSKVLTTITRAPWCEPLKIQDFRSSDLASSLWLADEAKIETEQEEDEMDDGAATADLRCFDKTCPQKRHRNIGEIEIEQNAR
jgi:hypothetical protein